MKTKQVFIVHTPPDTDRFRLAKGPTLRAACVRLLAKGATRNQRVHIRLRNGSDVIKIGVGNTLNSLLICN